MESIGIHARPRAFDSPRRAAQGWLFECRSPALPHNAKFSNFQDYLQCTSTHHRRISSNECPSRVGCTSAALSHAPAYRAGPVGMLTHQWQIQVHLNPKLSTVNLRTGSDVSCVHIRPWTRPWTIAESTGVLPGYVWSLSALAAPSGPRRGCFEGVFGVFVMKAPILVGPLLLGLVERERDEVGKH